MDLRRKRLVGIILIACILFVLVACSTSKMEVKQSSSISFSKVDFEIDIADTDSTRTKGLSKTKSLDQDKGLLFDFKKENNYGIWMKDMNYSLDIIWLDKNSKVVHIEESVAPQTYPKTFYPPKPAKYVLEINTHLSSKYEIKVGDIAEIRR